MAQHTILAEVRRRNRNRALKTAGTTVRSVKDHSGAVVVGAVVTLGPVESAQQPGTVTDAG